MISSLCKKRERGFIFSLCRCCCCCGCCCHETFIYDIPQIGCSQNNSTSNSSNNPSKISASGNGNFFFQQLKRKSIRRASNPRRVWNGCISRGKKSFGLHCFTHLRRRFSVCRCKHWQELLPEARSSWRWWLDLPHTLIMTNMQRPNERKKNGGRSFFFTTKNDAKLKAK